MDRKSRATRSAGVPAGTSELLTTEQALKASRAQLWALSAQHLRIQEGERKRVALELHDGLGQMLTLVKLNVEQAAYSIDMTTSNEVRTALQKVSHQLKDAVEELRRIAMNLRPSMLDELGIVATLAWYLRELAIASPGIVVDRDISVQETDVPEELKTAVFRIVQEATNNSLKYADAGHIKVHLARMNGLMMLLIEDNGRGFAVGDRPVRSDPGHGIGLRSMKERAEISGGNFEIRSSPGNGTRIGVNWPLAENPKAKCPVLRIPRKTAKSMCLAPSTGGALAKALSHCVNCSKDPLRGDEPSASAHGCTLRSSER